MNLRKAISRALEIIAPKDHAGRGAWDKNAEIPLIAWPLSALVIGLVLYAPWLAVRLFQIIGG